MSRGAGMSGTPRPSVAPRTPHRDPLPRRARSRHHMELAWERQLQHERLLSGTTAEAMAASADVVAVLDARHLERVLEVCSGAVVVLALHSASCGLCKEVLRDLGDVLCECRRQQARVVFLKHDIMDEARPCPALAGGGGRAPSGRPAQARPLARPASRRAMRPHREVSERPSVPAAAAAAV